MDREDLAPYEGREQSAVKHFLLESYLARLIMITARGHYARIAYVDAFAGPWQSSRDDLADTSFAKAVEVMEGCRVEIARTLKKSVTFRALFVERNPIAYQRLKAFVDERSTSRVQLEAINEDFAESAASVANWVQDGEMSFVLIDPTGWKQVISPGTLAPLLRKRNVEMLINVMWNFIALASGHEHQEGNLRELFGDDYKNVHPDDWMRTYLDRLRATAGEAGSASRLRAASFAIEFPSRERVYYYLTYVTHHVKGMIVFLEESARAATYQEKVKFVVSQRQRETASGIPDMFGDEIDTTRRPRTNRWDARELWLSLLPTKDMEAVVDEDCIADMAERCECLISELQEALRRLIEEGSLQNMNSQRPRPKNVVNYHKREILRRVR